jgi:CRP-like cAMP-binding protein
MVAINTPFSIWIQLMSLSFFSAGVFSDLLIIRLCLSIAYSLLFLDAILGSPLWPEVISPHRIQPDAMFWALANMYVHISSAIRLLRDEGSVDMNEDQEALWRLFYRTGGLSQKLFYRSVAKDMTLQTFNPTEHIPTDKWFYIIYRGTVQLRVSDGKTIVSSREAQSGQMFDFKDLNLLHGMEVFKKHQDSEAHAISPVTVFRFPRDRMADIANHPDTKAIWQQLLMENLGVIAQRLFDKNFKSQDVNKEYESPMFKPLQSWERPNPMAAGSAEALRNPLRHIFANMVWSFSPPWPFSGARVGLRHSLPAPSRDRHVLPDNMLNIRESKLFARFRKSSSMVASFDAEATEEDKYRSRYNGRNSRSSIKAATIDEDGVFEEYLKENDEERAMAKDKKQMGETIRTEEGSVSETTGYDV